MVTWVGKSKIPGIMYDVIKVSFFKTLKWRVQRSIHKSLMPTKYCFLSISKVYIAIVPISFFFFTHWKLILRFVSITFWTQIPESSCSGSLSSTHFGILKNCVTWNWDNALIQQLCFCRSPATCWVFPLHKSKREVIISSVRDANPDHFVCFCRTLGGPT